MKKFYTLLMMTAFSLALSGQSFILENFSSEQMPPQNWSIENLESQWSINNDDVAGGISPEGKFTYTSGTHLTRLISPAVDLSGISTVTFSFKHYYDDFTGAGPKLGVATRSGGGDWESVWEIDPTSNVGPEEKTLEVDNDDVGQSDFQICFYIDGNMYNIDYWYVDDIWLYDPLNLDCNLDGITMSKYHDAAAEVTGRIKNLGLDQINSFDAHWKIDGGEWNTTSFSGLEIDFSETYEFSYEQYFDFPIGSYNLTLMVDNLNGSEDQDPSNNQMSKELVVVSHANFRRVCFEEFTSSTCPPCATLNSDFVPWCEENAEDIALLKYQMNWPGSGDPYYTAEGGVRKDYYGVSGVPAVFVNGEYIGYQFGGVQPAFDNALPQPGLFSIASSHQIDGTEVTVDVNLVPFTDFEQHRVYIAVFEYLTTGNVGSNGETEFEHVMMKMIPDAEGTIVDFTDREPVSISETVDMAQTNVEEWDDLGVIVFVQNYSTQEVFQSAYSAEDAVFATDALLSDLTVNGESIEGFDPEVFEYDVMLEAGTTEIPAVEGFASDENALPIVVPAYELPGTAMVDVFAEDRLTNNTYTVNFLLNTGITEIASDVKVFPNPAKDKIFIQGDEIREIRIYNVLGDLVVSKKNPGNNIHLGNQANGVYMLQIYFNDSNVITKKISIRK